MTVPITPLTQEYEEKVKAALAIDSSAPQPPLDASTVQRMASVALKDIEAPARADQSLPCAHTGTAMQLGPSPFQAAAAAGTCEHCDTSAFCDTTSSFCRMPSCAGDIDSVEISNRSSRQLQDRDTLALANKVAQHVRWSETQPDMGSTH